MYNKYTSHHYEETVIDSNIDLVHEWTREKVRRNMFIGGLDIDIGSSGLKREIEIYSAHRHSVWHAKKRYYRNDEHIAMK